MSKHAFIFNILALTATLCAAPSHAEDAKLNALISKAREMTVPPPSAPQAAQQDSRGSGVMGYAKSLLGGSAKEWTVMVYMNGKNDLEPAEFYNLNQMEIAGSTAKISIVAEMGRKRGENDADLPADKNWTGVRRYFVENDYAPPEGLSPEQQRQLYRQSMDRVNSKPIWSAPSSDPASDMGNYESVISFVQWAREKYPAKKYMLILWDHGTGWMDPKLKRGASITTAAISWDTETNNIIGTADIGKILRKTGAVDVLGFDACLMQMAEVAFEIKDGAGYIFGSEELLPGAGIDYTYLLSSLAKSPEASPEAAAGFAVDAVEQFYKKLGRETAMLSVIKTSALGGFASALDDWGAAAFASKDTEALKFARDNVLRFAEFGRKDPKREISTYGDIYHFAELAGQKNQRLKEAAAPLLKYISGELVVKNAVVSAGGFPDYGNARGISLDIPRPRSDIKDSDMEDKFFSNKHSDFAFAKAVPRWELLCQWIKQSFPAKVDISKKDEPMAVSSQADRRADLP
ncbi:MAG: clostripain-related cysteine peptidase [Elusimicrobiales bacterium]